MTQISIFAKHVYLLDGRDGVYLQRISSRIRGEEIATYLGAKFNPTEPEGVCIYVKPIWLDHIKDVDYVDMLDGYRLLELLKKRPGIKVIAMSQSHYEFLKKELKNEVILIPHHHVNFDRVKRDRKEITTCGYVGVNHGYDFKVNDRVKEALKSIGLAFVPLFNFTNRQDIIEYYKKIDIQVIGYFDYLKDSTYYHPTKIINAMSFGIPTVAGERLGYSDVRDFYAPVGDMDELLIEVQKLKQGWDADRLIKEAEKYHIDNVSKLYKQL